MSDICGRFSLNNIIILKVVIKKLKEYYVKIN